MKTDDNSQARSIRDLERWYQRERQLLGLELHDTFVQDIVGAKMLVETAIAQLSADDLQPVELLNECKQILGCAIEDARAMISQLQLPTLDADQLIAAIRDLVERNKSGGVSIQLTHETSTGTQSPELCSMIYRIVQEALRNVQRHSQATEAIVKILPSSQQIDIEVHDNGIGFDPDQVPSDRFGIQSIIQRASLLGGSARVESKPGGGTSISVQLPVGS